MGRVLPETVARALTPDTALVSVMYSNNEIGTVNPIRAIADLCRARGVPCTRTPSRAAAYLPVDVDALGVDLLSLGAHKFYGPKGIGALYIRKGTPIQSLLTGGGQEFGLRAGTHNVPLIVGLAEALRLANLEREERTARLKPLRDRIIATVLETIPDLRLTGSPGGARPQPCQFRVQECGWQPAGQPARFGGFCLFCPARPAKPATRNLRKCCSLWGCRARGRSVRCG